MEMDPVAIFTFILRLAPFIMTVVIVSLFFFLLKGNIVTDEMERASVELGENLFASQLTSEKYVFNPSQLEFYSWARSNANINRELPFLRSCGYEYYIEVKDHQSGNTWEFGYADPKLRRMAAIGS